MAYIYNMLWCSKIEILADTVLPEEGYEIDDDEEEEENGSADFGQRSDLESGQQDKAKLPSSGIPALEMSTIIHTHTMHTWNS